MTEEFYLKLHSVDGHNLDYRYKGAQRVDRPSRQPVKTTLRHFAQI